jgi:importin subunit beta-1
MHLLMKSQAQSEGSTELRDYFSFAKIATLEVIPVILGLLTKQDEDAADDEYNISRAAYQCLQLWASCVQNPIVAPVLQFVEKNLRAEDWHLRDAAVSAFGAITEGPDPKMLDPLIKQALPPLIGMMDDPVIQVKDSAAYALGRICAYNHTAIDPTEHLPPLIASLFTGLAAHPKIASSCCWALMNLAEQFSSAPDAQRNPLTPHFQASVSHLLLVTERPDADNNLRTAAYEVLNAFVNNAAIESLPLVADLSNVILERLEKTIPMQSQVVSIEDKMTLEEMQVSLTSVVVAIIGRLDAEIKPQGDRIMKVSLELLDSSGARTPVPDIVFTAVGNLASALDADFFPYMEHFAPYLFKGLENQEDPSICSMSIGLVSDITRALGDRVQPWCDGFMNRLLQNLQVRTIIDCAKLKLISFQSQTFTQQFKPAILQTFGDIAQAIGGAFETYLPVVVTVLGQASLVKAGPEAPFEMHEYIVSLREGIMDAWDGIILASIIANKPQMVAPNVESIMHLVHSVFVDQNRSESLMRSSMGVIGYVFPNLKCLVLKSI